VCTCTCRVAGMVGPGAQPLAGGACYSAVALSDCSGVIGYGGTRTHGGKPP
jgi:hypothetical protein